MEQGLKRTNEALTTGTIKVEDAYKSLGIKSDQVYEMMRANATAAVDFIKNKTLSSTDEIARAQKAAADKISQINAQQYGEHTSLIDKLKSNWIAASVAIYAAWSMVQKAWSMAEMAASYNEQMTLLDGLARKYGTTSTAIVDSIRAAGEGMIAMSTAAEVATGALAKGLSPDMLIGLANAAVTLKEVMGTTADETFKRLAEALEANKEKSLKLAVGVIDLKDRYGEMAATMTETQKQTALYNMIMEKVKEIQDRTGQSTKSVADEMETLKVTLKDLELTMGQGIIRAGAGAVAMFQSLAAAALYVASGVTGLGAAFLNLASVVTTGELSKSLKSQADAWRSNADAMLGASGELITKASANFKLMTASTQDLTTATAKQAAASDLHKQSEGERQKVVAEVTKALEAYSKVVQKYGEDTLKLGKDAFGESLKVESVTIAEMQTGMTSYLAIIKQVYDTRIQGEKDISDAMEKAGAKPKDQLEALAQVAKEEKNSLVARADVWKSYYDVLAQAHAKSTEQMKTKTAELKKLEDDLAEARKTGAQKMLDLQYKYMEAQGIAADSEQVWTLKNIALQDQWDLAMSTSGLERDKQLKQYIQMAGELTGQVVAYGQGSWTTADQIARGNLTVMTSQDAISLAYDRTAFAQKALTDNLQGMIAAKQAEIGIVEKTAAAETAEMTKAKSMMSEYQGQVDALAQKIAGMDKVIALTVDAAQAGAAINEVRAQLEALVNRQWSVNLSATGGARAGQVAGGGTAQQSPDTSAVFDFKKDYGDYSSPDWQGVGAVDLSPSPAPASDWGSTPWFGEYAMGTNYVPRTGPYLLHQGESVKTAAETKGGGGGVVVNMTNNIQAGSKSPERLADELVKPLQIRLRALNASRQA